MITILPTVTLDSEAADIPPPGANQLFVFFTPDGTLNAKLPDGSIVQVKALPADGAGTKTIVLPSDWGPGALLSEDTSGNLITIPPGKLGSILRITGAGVLAWADPATLSQAYGLPEAPDDGHLYGRQSDAWAVVPPIPANSGGIPDAPDDGQAYVRQGGAWVVLASGGTTTPTAPTTPSGPTVAASSDEFNGAALDPKWAWINQGAATANVADGVLTMVGPAIPSDSLSMLLQPVPGGNFTMSTSAVFSAAHTDFPQAGMVLYNSANGKCMTFMLIYHDGQIKPSMDAWSSDTQYVTVVGGFGGPMPSADLKLIVNGDTIQSFYAAIGADNSIVFQTGSVNGIMGGGITHVGLFVNGTGQEVVTMEFDYFRVTVP